MKTASTCLAAIALLATAACSGRNAPSADEQGASINQAQVSLPADPGERAATCYAARALTFGDGDGLAVEQANEAAHFLLIGASTSGVTEPTKVAMLQQVAKAAEPAVRASGQAENYLAACHAAYPATARKFAGLGADSRDTRLQCFALMLAMGQIYAQSPQIKGDRLARYHALNERLDTDMTAELAPAGQVNPAEVASLTARGLATAIELGPITETLDACAARYGG